MIRITVQVVPRAKRASVEPLEGGMLRVAVMAPPHRGRANEAVIETLAEHFHVARSKVRIVMGRTGKRKVVEIDCD